MYKKNRVWVSEIFIKSFKVINYAMTLNTSYHISMHQKKITKKRILYLNLKKSNKP